MTTATPYYDAIQLIERLHRHFLDVLKVELDRKGIQDINNVQSMILYNIGHDELTVGELTIRGYYLGSNVSYNVKKMVEILDSTDARQSSQAKAHELVDQALAGLDGVSQEGQKALVDLGRWAAEGGR